MVFEAHFPNFCISAHSVCCVCFGPPARDLLILMFVQSHVSFPRAAPDNHFWQISQCSYSTENSDDEKRTNTTIKFYRATLCVNGTCCPSDTPMNCIQTAKDFVKVFLDLVVPSLGDPALARSMGTHSAGAINIRGRKNLWFSTEIAVYLANSTRWAHVCYGTLIGS